jgi:hypothetical protein
MLNPGLYSLKDANGNSDFTITTAGTQVGTWVEGLDGMLSMLASLRLAYGSGGISITAYLQCSADGGTTAHDIATVLFGTAAEHALLNFSALTPKTTQVTPTDGALANDTAVDGLIANMVRLKVVSVGTYAGSTVLSGRITAR